MKYFLGFVLGITFIFVVAYLLPESGGRYYDCGMAEWHPDYPPAVKEECRKRFKALPQERKGVTT